MLLSLQSIGNTVSAHPWLTLLLFLLTSAIVLHYFSDVSLGEVFGGVFRLLGSIFVAPFHFIRTAVSAIAGFNTTDAVDANSRTYLLHRSIEYTRLGALVGAILLVATGLTVAILGVWPSEQFAQRKALRAQLTSVDSTYAADSLRLAELTSAGQAEIAQRREALRDSLRQRRTEIATSVTAFWQSVNNTVPAPDRWSVQLDSAILAARPASAGDATADEASAAEDNLAGRLMNRLINSEPGEEVWTDDPYRYRYTEDSVLVASAGPVRQALSALVKADTAWREVERGFLLALSAVETQQALVNALRVGSTEQEVAQLQSQMAVAMSQRETARQALNDIPWFAGVTFFFLTLLYTYLLFVAFVWAVGIAIETTLLFVGIAQDIAALRKRSE